MTIPLDPARASYPDVDSFAREGAVIAGKYRVERVLGGGGMGVVLAAHHVALRQPVAVKVLRPEVARQPGATERFLREAQATASIRSEHVVRVTDMGVLEGGAPYLVMEHLSGMDLERVAVTRGRLPIHEAVDYLLQACEAIAEAHAAGIVHRDIKPANIFLTFHADGTPLVKVLDFGLSKATRGEPGEVNLTATDTVIGSPLYMSPEQIRSLKHVDARTDVWALGVTLYRLLVGRCPFARDSAAGALAAIIAEPPPALRTQRPEIPAALDTAILRCLEKDAGRRVQTVAELATLLEPFGSPRAALSVERISGVMQAPRAQFPTLGAQVPEASRGGATTAAVRAWTYTQPGPRRRAFMVAGLVGLVLVIGLAAGLLRPEKPGPAAQASRITIPIAPPTASRDVSVLSSSAAEEPTIIRGEGPAPSATVSVSTATAAASSLGTAAPTPPLRHSPEPRPIRQSEPVKRVPSTPAPRPPQEKPTLETERTREDMMEKWK